MNKSTPDNSIDDDKIADRVVDETSAMLSEVKETTPVEVNVEHAKVADGSASGINGKSDNAQNERRANAKKKVAAKLNEAIELDNFQGSLSVMHDKECMWYIGQEMLNAVHTRFVQPAQKLNPRFRVDFVAAVASQGYMFGPWIARSLNAGFVPVRLHPPTRLTTESMIDPLSRDLSRQSADAGTASADQHELPSPHSTPTLCAEINVDMFRRSRSPSSEIERPIVLLVEDYTIQGWVVEAALKALMAIDVALAGVFVIFRGRDSELPTRPLNFGDIQTEILFDLADTEAK